MILHVVVIDRGVRAVWRVTVVRAARVEQWEFVGVLVLSVDGFAVHSFAHFRRVSTCSIVVEADQRLMEVVVLCVATTLIQD